jgi:ribosomal protein L37AE/L43A
MAIPQLKLVANGVWKCPACRQPYVGNEYPGTPQEKLIAIQVDYEKHFKTVHMREDASQAAARVVREATKE